MDLSILVPDAGGYSSKLKAVYLHHLVNLAFPAVLVRFCPVDDAPYVDVVKIYGEELGLPVGTGPHTHYLQVSTATRLRQYGFGEQTSETIFSLFDNKKTLSDLAGGYEIPYMTSAHYNAVFRGTTIVKPAVGSGSKGLRTMNNSTQGHLDDHQIIQAMSDDDREYVQDVWLNPNPHGIGAWSLERQSLKRDEGRDTAVLVGIGKTCEGLAMQEFRQFLAERLFKFGLNDSLWLNVQYRYYNGILRVMEIDSRISGSAQVNPEFGIVLMDSLGFDVSSYSPSRWRKMCLSARQHAYMKVGLGVEIMDLESKETGK
jgi:hypothetical protein